MCVIFNLLPFLRSSPVTTRTDIFTISALKKMLQWFRAWIANSRVMVHIIHYHATAVGSILDSMTHSQSRCDWVASSACCGLPLARSELGWASAPAVTLSRINGIDMDGMDWKVNNPSSQIFVVHSFDGPGWKMFFCCVNLGSVLMLLFKAELSANKNII